MNGTSSSEMPAEAVGNSDCSSDDTFSGQGCEFRVALRHGRIFQLNITQLLGKHLMFELDHMALDGNTRDDGSPTGSTSETSKFHLVHCTFHEFDEFDMIPSAHPWQFLN